jgi:hypothetical protein
MSLRYFQFICMVSRDVNGLGHANSESSRGKHIFTVIFKRLQVQEIGLLLRATISS